MGVVGSKEITIVPSKEKGIFGSKLGREISDRTRRGRVVSGLKDILIGYG